MSAGPLECLYPRVYRAGKTRGRSSLPFDAEQRLEARHLAGQLGLFGRVYYRAHVLVGTGGFLGHASEGGAADQDATARQLVHDLAALPLFRGLGPAHAATGAM